MTDPRPVVKKLSYKEKRYLSFCEEYYFLNNFGFPSNEVAAENLGYSASEIAVFLQNTKLQEALDRRGLPWTTAGLTSYQGNKSLTPLQLAVALTTSNFADTRSIEVKLSELGVLPAQYYAWLNDNNFQAFVRRLADRNLDLIYPEAIQSFSKLIREGEFQALKYYFEVTGHFKAPEIQNVQVLVQKLIESVQRHVKDPAVLQAISSDLLGAAPVAEVTSGNDNNS